MAMNEISAKPFSDNIIFYDSEFSSLDPEKGDLLSVAMVKMNGEELYFELEHEGEVDPWVKDNVMPYLTGEKIGKEEALERMKKFAGSKTPFLLSYVDNYDAVYLKKIIGQAKRNIFHWMSIDIASMFFAVGRNPEDFGDADKNGMFKELGIDFSKYREHHALDDAKLLREFYMKFFKINA
jgi:DNA polymerase III epsilon subunit-like protein